MTDSSSSSDAPHESCHFDAQKLILKLSVTLCADRKAVDPVVQSVMNVVREMKCAEGREDSIELALAEALSNAVVHGASSDPTKIIECDVACDETHGMLIVVRDPGPGFDVSKLPDPCPGGNIFARPSRGLYP